MNVYDLKILVNKIFFDHFWSFWAGHRCVGIITRCLSLPKRNDKKCLKNAFFSPFTMTQNPFWVSRHHIQWKKAQNFHKCLWSGWGGDPPPYGQADRTGGSLPPSLTISICENFGLFFPLKMIPWYSKRFFCHCEGAEKCPFQALFVISFWQTQASSDGATRIYAQPKMVKNGQKW